MIFAVLRQRQRRRHATPFHDAEDRYLLFRRFRRIVFASFDISPPRCRPMFSAAFIFSLSILIAALRRFQPIRPPLRRIDVSSDDIVFIQPGALRHFIVD
jgi:hypothetical protein